MSHRKFCSAIVALALLAAPGIAAPGTAPARTPATEAAAKAQEVTGQHRGYTNDELYLRLDDGREMTFVVRIPGDKEARWHEQFATLSRITVTYQQAASDKKPIAVAIRKAEK